MPTTLSAGAYFPPLIVPKAGGGEIMLSEVGGGDKWGMVIVYRGKHCPLCAKYFKQLEEMKATFEELNIGIVGISADPEEKALAFIEDTGTTVPIGYNLSVDQMKPLGLFISDPRSPEETDRPFAEPGLFVVQGDGTTRIIDVSNAPFARPDLQTLAGGIKFLRANTDYPVRGTH